MPKNVLYIQRKEQLYFQRGDNMGFKMNPEHPYLRPFYLKIFRS